MTGRKRPRSRGLLTKLGLSAASLVLTVVLLELIFRLIVPDNPPGTTYGRPVTRNSLGFRERELDIPKPEETYRIVVLGDSFTWGVGLDVEQAMPRVLERRLSDAVTRGTIEVVNAAEPGHNTVEEYLLLKEKGMRYQPDMVLLAYNLNDIEYLPHLSETSAERAATPVVEIDPGEEITQYSRNAGFRGLVLAVERRSVFAQFLVPRVGAVLRRLGLVSSVEFSWVEKLYQGYHDANPGWLESKRALAAIADLCRAEGCDFLVAIFPLFVELDDYQGKEVHEEILRFCRDAGILAVDLLPIFENTRAASHWINFMDAHPNAEAHRAVAERLLPAVRERLVSRQAGVSSEPSSGES